MALPTLTRPEHLWWLAVVVPVLFWLAQPPRPRRAVITAHRSQWLLAQAALRRRPPRFRALRWLLLTVAAVLATAALGAPEGGGAPGPRRLVVIVDESASMAAVDPGTDQSRAERCRRRVQQELAAVPADVDVQLVRLCDRGVVRLDGPAARAFADACEPRGVLPASLTELAAAAVTPTTAVWTLGDAQNGDVPDVGAFTCVAPRDPSPNAAITAVSWLDGWPLPDLRVIAVVQSAGAQSLRGEVRVEGAVEAAATVAVELAPGRPARVELPVRRATDGGALRVVAAFAGDALARDDAVELSLPPLPAPRIAVLADDDARFANVAARALADELGGEVVPAQTGVAVGLLLVEGGSAPLQPGQAPVLAFGVRPAAAAAAPAVWPAPQVVDWDRRDTLTAGLDFSELEIRHALRAALPPGTPLLWGSSPDGPQPLCVVADGDRAASLHFAFRLQDSNLPLLPAFPQLLRRALSRVHRASGGIAIARGPADPAEADLSTCRPAPDRPLPAFGEPARDLAPWCLLAALVLLAARACVR